MTDATSGSVDRVASLSIRSKRSLSSTHRDLGEADGPRLVRHRTSTRRPARRRTPRRHVRHCRPGRPAGGRRRADHVRTRRARSPAGPGERPRGRGRGQAAPPPVHDRVRRPRRRLRRAGRRGGGLGRAGADRFTGARRHHRRRHHPPGSAHHQRPRGPRPRPAGRRLHPRPGGRAGGVGEPGGGIAGGGGADPAVRGTGPRAARRFRPRSLARRPSRLDSGQDGGAVRVCVPARRPHGRPGAPQRHRRRPVRRRVRDELPGARRRPRPDRRRRPARQAHGNRHRRRRVHAACDHGPAGPARGGAPDPAPRPAR